MTFSEAEFNRIIQSCTRDTPRPEYRVTKFSKRALVAELYPRIIEHRRSGYSLEGICEWLKEHGAHMSEGTLQKYLQLAAGKASDALPAAHAPPAGERPRNGERKPVRMGTRRDGSARRKSARRELAGSANGPHDTAPTAAAEQRLKDAPPAVRNEEAEAAANGIGNGEQNGAAQSRSTGEQQWSEGPVAAVQLGSDRVAARMDAGREVGVVDSSLKPGTSGRTPPRLDGDDETKPAPPAALPAAVPTARMLAGDDANPQAKPAQLNATLAGAGGVRHLADSEQLAAIADRVVSVQPSAGITQRRGTFVVAAEIPEDET